MNERGLVIVRMVNLECFGTRDGVGGDGTGWHHIALTTQYGTPGPAGASQAGIARLASVAVVWGTLAGGVGERREKLDEDDAERG